MSKKITLIVAVLFGIMTIWGCSGTAPEPKPEPSGRDVPEWYLSIPDDPDYLWAVGEGRSTDLGMAREKAAIVARTSIAKQQELKLKSLTKRSLEEWRTDDKNSQLLDRFETLSTGNVSTTLLLAQQVKIHVTEKGQMKQVYVLFNYPLGVEELNNRLKESRRFGAPRSASQAIEELEKEIEKYEQSKP